MHKDIIILIVILALVVVVVFHSEKYTAKNYGPFEYYKPKVEKFGGEVGLDNRCGPFEYFQNEVGTEQYYKNLSEKGISAVNSVSNISKVLENKTTDIQNSGNIGQPLSAYKNVNSPIQPAVYQTLKIPMGSVGGVGQK